MIGQRSEATRRLGGSVELKHVQGLLLLLLGGFRLCSTESSLAILPENSLDGHLVMHSGLARPVDPLGVKGWIRAAASVAAAVRERSKDVMVQPADDQSTESAVGQIARLSSFIELALG